MHINNDTLHILASLKKDPYFYTYCTQQKLTIGSTVPLINCTHNLYFIESGFIQCLRDIGTDEPLHIIMQPGDFPYLPFNSEDYPEITACEALTDIILWKIDISFFKKMMHLENLDETIFAIHSDKSSKNIEEHFLMDRLHPEERIYFSLLIMMRLGSLGTADTAQLPAFVTYEKIAEYSLTSVDFTAEILNNLQKNNLISLDDNWTITNVIAFNAMLASKNILTLENSLN
ncbi:hypothetical protein [Listeria rocourtiae]|uniref:hypothetical protein n=1 Tax=Listeria rocourtiae TaxID=647910 RepID=UPI003D2F956D